ncbi:DUF3106 domain-containing protein [Acidovorax sp. Leaf160]|uniref:DUF3106 domain-containing protein n=1 Tax=Acidovorax sp. Leaf160 TaxID=1736280 RepID=UPI0007018941|nr:DUF3106 domain-containing protein [Acidovorax sp. Leaf160]KQR55311.1 hypothetical protein ASF94_02305 [Acidovorax sp. Leaf160]
MPLSPSDAPRILPAAVLAFALLGGLAYGGWQVIAQVRTAPGTAVPAEALASQHAKARSASAAPPAVRRVSTPEPAEPVGPGWNELTSAQRQALAPLAERWPVLSEAQKRHWINLAGSFRSLSAEEQAKMVERMTVWASLSTQQRSQARFNYAATARLAPDSKRAQWEAYQALSAEEKNRLAARAAPKADGAALSLHPVSPRKLAKVPAAAAVTAASPANPPKIPPVSAFHSPQALPVLAPASSSSSPPFSSPGLVETAPVNVPSAVAQPLPPAASASETSAAPVDRDFTPIHPPQ